MTRYITETQGDRLMARVLHVAKELRGFARDYGDDVYGLVSDGNAYLVADLESRLSGWFDLVDEEDLDAMFASPHYFPNRFKADLELDYKDFYDKYDYDPYVYCVSREDDSRRNRLAYLRYLVEDKKLVR